MLISNLIDPALVEANPSGDGSSSALCFFFFFFAVRGHQSESERENLEQERGAEGERATVGGQIQND